MPRPVALPELEDLNHAFQLDPGLPSGLRWRNPLSFKMKPGQPAGSIMSNGYWQVCLRRKAYLCSRIVYKIYNNGIDPGEFEVDHYDRNKSNNAGSNLILATAVDQQVNRAAVGEVPYRNVWIDRRYPGFATRYASSVRYRINGIRKHVIIGYFANPYEASLAALEYKKENGLRCEYAPGGTV
jgi:hypothetical protein